MHPSLKLPLCASCYVTRPSAAASCPPHLPPYPCTIGTNILKPVSSPLVNGNGLSLLHSFQNFHQSVSPVETMKWSRYASAKTPDIPLAGHFPFASLCPLSTLLFHVALRPGTCSFQRLRWASLPSASEVGMVSGKPWLENVQKEKYKVRACLPLSPSADTCQASLSLQKLLFWVPRPTPSPFSSRLVGGNGSLLDCVRLRTLAFALKFSSPASPCVYDPLNSPHICLLPPGTVSDTVQILLH